MGAICCGSQPGGRDDDPGPGTEGKLLVQAAMCGDVEQLKSLLRMRIDVEEQYGNKTALSLAIEARKNSPECVRVLAEARANLENTNWCGETPLILCANLGDAKCVAELLQGGAKVDARDGTGRRAVIAAAETAHATGGVRCLEVLLAARANIDVVNDNGDNALIRAAATGHLKSAALLVESMANVDATDSLGKTALMIASDREHKDVVHKIEKLLKPMIITLQVSPETGADGLTPVSFTNMMGEEVAALQADFGKPVAYLRAAVREQIVGQLIQIILPDGRFLAFPEDGQLLGDVIGDVIGDVVGDELLI